MISLIRGQLVDKSPTRVIIENNGIGLEVLIPVSTFEKLDAGNESVTLLTYLHVREDALTLYGFATAEERELFRELLSVSGIGPKLALSILSGSTVDKLYRYIADGDENSLTKIRGLGKKTAQRLILDLRDKAGDKMKQVSPSADPLSLAFDEQAEQSVLALISLGYVRKEAESAVAKAMKKRGSATTAEELIRMALSGE
ncbi:Holliday junction branch migration protein RuvA [candidate division KSB1 bacterium]|nr:Holliday junction branch migration protein RuvA [candidate division KSB1 bacterium]RQW07511.1 MAG: Holliday junction branch migration protein RuvA [candidate division KSB1 bacterium]